MTEPETPNHNKAGHRLESSTPIPPGGLPSNHFGVSAARDGTDADGRGVDRPPLPAYWSGVPERIGKYQVERVLGTGSFGRVYLAQDDQAGRKVAIKQPFGQGADPAYLPSFLKEARAAAAIVNQYVCPVYHVDEDEKQLPYIVMRYVDGTLRGLLTAHPGPLLLQTAVRFAGQIALGLDGAHAKGVIHRDLKPENILYDAESQKILITDFGLARIAARPHHSISGEDKKVLSAGPPVANRGHSPRSVSGKAHGTAHYMPPEQWGSDAFGQITPGADVYSLGVILYEMLTGQCPFDGDHDGLKRQHCFEPPIGPSIHRPDVDDELERICLKALAKQPTDRFPSAKAFADALTDYLRRKPELIEAPRLSGPAPPRPAPPPVAPPLPPRPVAPAPPPVPPKPPAQVVEEPVVEVELVVEKEVVRCPKCRKRLEIAIDRTQPIDCPLCEIRFSVQAARQAGRAPKVEEPELADPVPVARPVARKPQRRTRADEDARERVPKRRRLLAENDEAGIGCLGFVSRLILWMVVVPFVILMVVLVVAAAMRAT